MAFQKTGKDFQSKNAMGKKVYILAKDINTERKQKKCRPEKDLFFGAPKFRELKSNCLDFGFVHLITKY